MTTDSVKIRRVQYLGRDGWTQLTKVGGESFQWNMPVVQQAQSYAPTLDELLESRRARGEVIKEQHVRGLELAKALSTCITAMNPPDRDGISMHEWNQRLKAATKQACAVFDGSDSVQIRKAEK